MPPHFLANLWGFLFALAVMFVLFVVSIIRLVWKVVLPLNPTLFLLLSVMSFFMGGLLLSLSDLETFRTWALLGIVGGEAFMAFVGYETPYAFAESLGIQAIEFVMVALLFRLIRRTRNPVGQGSPPW